MPTYWGNYHSRGDAGPRFDLLDSENVIIDSYTFTDIMSGSIPALGSVAPDMAEGFEPVVKTYEANDGEIHDIAGGFRYRAALKFGWLDRTYAGYVNTILNHCAKGGKYKVKFFPHSDYTSVYFVCRVNGMVTDPKVNGHTFSGGYTAELDVYATEPIKQVPYLSSYALICRSRAQWGALSASEKLHTQGGRKTSWGAYTASEKNNNLGYGTDVEDIWLLS